MEGGDAANILKETYAKDRLSDLLTKRAMPH